MIQDYIDIMLAAYTNRGGKHPEFALRWLGPDEWRAEFGVGRCPHVDLGEVPGEYMSDIMPNPIAALDALLNNIVHGIKAP